MDVPVETRDGNPQAQPVFEILAVAVNEMVRALIRLVDQRVMHVDRLHVTGAFVEWG